MGGPSRASQRLGLATGSSSRSSCLFEHSTGAAGIQRAQTWPRKNSVFLYLRAYCKQLRGDYMAGFKEEAALGSTVEV